MQVRGIQWKHLSQNQSPVLLAVKAEIGLSTSSTMVQIDLIRYLVINDYM